MFEKSLNSISFASPLKSSLFSPEPKPTKLQNASTLQSPPVNTPSNSNRQDYSPFIIKNSFYTNSTSKTLNFLTEKKRKSSTKVYTPSPNVSKGEKFSDRFIPMNKGLNLLEKFNLANAINEDDENLNSTNLDKDSIYYQKCVNYNEVLKRNVLMSENSASSFFNNRSLTNCTSTSSSSNRSIKSNIFSFKTNSKQKQQTLSSMITHRKNTKQKMPFGNESYLDEEEHTVRKINKKPYKIIPVDDLIDDFYLNLVDWSSHNDIAAGLGNAVGLWSSNQTQHSILCSYEDNDENGKYVSSVIWSPSGEHIAVGNSVGEVEVYDSKLNLSKYI